MCRKVLKMYPVRKSTKRPVFKRKKHMFDVRKELGSITKLEMETFKSRKHGAWRTSVKITVSLVKAEADELPSIDVDQQRDQEDKEWAEEQFWARF